MDSSPAPRAKEQYGNRGLEATAQSFWKYAVEVENKLSESRGQKCFLWVVSAPSCAIKHNNDRRCEKRDRAEIESERIAAGNPNVQFTASTTV